MPLSERMIKAIGSNNAVEVKRLLASGENVTAKDAKGATALHWAAKRGVVSVAIVLVSAGADLYAVNRDERTPLHNAAMYGRPDVIKFLVKAGVDVDISCLLYTSPSPRDRQKSRMPSSA